MAEMKLSDLALSSSQRMVIEQAIKEGGGSGSIEQEFAHYSPEVLANFLSRSFEQREAARAVLVQRHRFLQREGSIVDLHFSLHSLIKLFYRDRSHPEYYEFAKALCREQIAIQERVCDEFRKGRLGFTRVSTEIDGILVEGLKHTPAAHTGYKQLAIILEKEKAYAEAIALCEEAASSGWAGDWDKRIERLKKKLSKS